MSACVVGNPDPSMSLVSSGGGGGGGGSPPTHSKMSLLTTEKVLEKAEATGVVDLTCRNLKTFPKSGCQQRLKDTVVADLSRNRLTELPSECTDYSSLERLVLYHNAIRGIPESVVCLQSLCYLDLSRNQLSYLPETICQLSSLKGLVVNNNKLVSLPEEIGKMQALTELDACCNEITHLPVQIGDMTSLRSLNLRRNHLQEVPMEISFLRLVHLDLSGNRIANLPVEIRFMASLVDLDLGENPLSCPPANLCSRGIVHIFKHLEVQAVKEDRKRGVLTDSEYRRSYRKTTSGQLNDFRFANGFAADNRRKRHTADSGYGSELPHDRRWSQDFTQDAIDMHTEDARRIILRAANCPRSPQRPGGVSGPPGRSANSQILNVIGSRASATVSSSSSPAAASFAHPQPPPLTSTGSNSSGTSSGHSSMSCGAAPSPVDNGPVADTRPLPSPSSSRPMVAAAGANCAEQPSRLFPQGNNHSNSRLPITASSHHHNLPPQPPARHSSSASNLLEATYNYQENGQLTPNNMSNSEGQLLVSDGTEESSTSVGSRGGSPRSEDRDDQRKTSQSAALGGKQGQFKEQLRRQNAAKPTANGTSGDSTAYEHSSYHSQLSNYSGQTRSSHYSVTSSSNSSSSTMRLQSTVVVSSSSAAETAGGRKMYDMKALQKEAVLSYVKAKQSSPAHSAAAPDENEKRGVASPRLARNGARVATATNRTIPQPAASTSSKLQLGQGKSSMYQAYASKQFHPASPVKKDACVGSTTNSTGDAHIAQLKTTIESRLRITLPENISGALADGVILCHLANHVKPRAVTSIHVPSAAVPRLTPAKCKRNIENFLLSCKKLGVREDLMCSPADILEPRKQGTVRLAITVSELLRFYQPRQMGGLPMNNSNNHHQIGLQL